MDFGPIRAVKDDTILSPFLPRLGIRISSDFIYLGDLQYLRQDMFHIEDFIFLCPSSTGYVTRLLLVHFEGYLDSKEGAYEPPTGNPLHLEGDEYIHNLSFIGMPGFIEKHPGSDLAHSADYIRQRAYTLVGEMSLQRITRLVDNTMRNKFSILYLENHDFNSPDVKTLQQDEPALAALRERALGSFHILK